MRDPSQDAAQGEGRQQEALVTADNLFGAQEPLNQMVKINGINFRVTGVLKSKGDQGYFNPDDQVIIPYTTAMKQVFGLDYLREIDVAAKEGTNLSELQDRLTELIRKRHRLGRDDL